MENKELINKFREFVLSLSDQSKDFKDQALEILDNPEGKMVICLSLKLISYTLSSN